MLIKTNHMSKIKDLRELRTALMGATTQQGAIHVQKQLKDIREELILELSNPLNDSLALVRSHKCSTSRKLNNRLN